MGGHQSPHYPPSIVRSSSHQSPVDLDRIPEKIEYNGLTGVPTGPKSAIGRLGDEPVVTAFARHSPHIFIPASLCPTLPTTRKHLAKFLKISDQRICIDLNLGWRVIFEASPQGREKLQQCYQEFHLKTLFGSYVLNMQCFPNGDQGVTAMVDSGARPPAGSMRDLQHPPTGNTGSLENLTSRSESGLAKANTGSAEVVPNHSSPVGMRADKDDSSSISALTTSDTSGTKAAKCHVCKTGSLVPLDPLIFCTSCPRRYHHRCHKHPTSTLSDGSGQWQCQRCVKRQVPPGSRLSTSSLAADEQTSAPIHRRVELIEPTTANEERTHDDTASSCVSDMLRRSSQVAERAVHSREVTHSSEADKLVEMSFTDAGTKARQPKKTGRLNLVRKKLETGKTVLGDLGSHTDHHIVPGSGEASHGKTHQLHDLAEEGSRRNALSEAVQAETRQAGALGSDEIIEDCTATTVADLGAAGPINGSEETQDAPDATASNSKRNPKIKPTAPHLRTSQILTDASRTERKPHKWSGTGADKYIIEGGYNQLRDSECTHTKVRRDTAAARPEDVCDKHALRPDHDILGGQSTVASAPSPGAEAATNAAKTRDVLNASGPTVKRQKLANVATRQCVTCQKTIALNPSGTNVHCSRCKKGMNDSKTPLRVEQAESPLSLSVPHHKVDTALSSSADAVNELPEFSDLTQRKEPDTIVLGDGDNRHDLIGGATFSFPESGRPERVDQRTACDGCRKDHKRCVHHADTGPSDGNGESDVSDEEIDASPVLQTSKKRRYQSDRDSLANDEEVSLNDGQTNDQNSSTGEGPISAPVKAKIVRKSFRVVAKNERDLGNGYKRPGGSYRKLVGMALCAQEGYRMNSRDVPRWIAEHIPGYDLKHGNNWESGISATISQYRYKPPGEKQICTRPLWYTEGYDPNNKSKGSIVQLMPGVQHSMPQWRPEPKQPTSSKKLQDTTPVSRIRETASVNNMCRKRSRKSHLQQDESEPGNESHDTERGSDQLGEMGSLGDLNDVAMRDVEYSFRSTYEVQKEQQKQHAPSGLLNDNSETSDDEPILRRKRFSMPEVSNGEGREPLIAQEERYVAVPDADHDAVEQAEADTPRTLDAHVGRTDSPVLVRSPGMSTAQEHQSTAARPLQTLERQADPKNVASAFSLADIIKRDSQNMDYSALSLFEEWPEYDPSRNNFHKAAKLAEIKARPRRKQRFRMPLTRDPWVEPRPPPDLRAQSSRQSPASFDRTVRTPSKMQKIFNPWQSETGEANEIVYETWEEFFDLPTNPIPILQDGQLAYRDGMHNDDGMLRRAKMIFKTGYA